MISVKLLLYLTHQIQILFLKLLKLSSFYYILTEFNNMGMQLRQALAAFGWADEEIFNLISNPVLGTYSLVLSIKNKFGEDGISNNLFKLAEKAYANLSNQFASSHYLRKSILIKQLALIQINYDLPGAIKTLQLSNDIKIWDDVIQASLADRKFNLAEACLTQALSFSSETPLAVLTPSKICQAAEIYRREGGKKIIFDDAISKAVSIISRCRKGWETILALATAAEIIVRFDSSLGKELFQSSINLIDDENDFRHIVVHMARFSWDQAAFHAEKINDPRIATQTWFEMFERRLDIDIQSAFNALEKAQYFANQIDIPDIKDRWLSRISLALNAQDDQRWVSLIFEDTWGKGASQGDQTVILQNASQEIAQAIQKQDFKADLQIIEAEMDRYHVSDNHRWIVMSNLAINLLDGHKAYALQYLLSALEYWQCTIAEKWKRAKTSIMNNESRVESQKDENLDWPTMLSDLIISIENQSELTNQTLENLYGYGFDKLSYIEVFGFWVKVFVLSINFDHPITSTSILKTLEKELHFSKDLVEPIEIFLS